MFTESAKEHGEAEFQRLQREEAAIADFQRFAEELWNKYRASINPCTVISGGQVKQHIQIVAH